MHQLLLLAPALLFGLGSLLGPGGPADTETSGAPGEVPDPWLGLDERLVQLMRAGIETTEPHGKNPSENASVPPFDGSWDWHSSVIAHWALLNHARRSGDADLGAWVLARVPDDVLASQYAFLRERDPKHRMLFPYDEGWLCMLLSELARHRDETEAMRAVRVELEGRLLDHLESRAFPENLGLGEEQREAGRVRFCGFYRSSLFLYLQLSWSNPVREEAASRLATWRRETLEPQREAIGAISAGSGYDFLWVPALLALVDRLDAEPDEPYTQPEFEAWPESLTIREVHMLGRELCAVWPLATGSAEEHALYRARVGSLLMREEFWAEDFMVCSHWIPQYLYLGEWLRAGRP